MQNISDDKKKIIESVYGDSVMTEEDAKCLDEKIRNGELISTKGPSKEKREMIEEALRKHGII